jgi:hypothetical protein
MEEEAEMKKTGGRERVKMKGYRRHIAASVAIVAVFVVSAVTVGLAAVSPAPRSGMGEASVAEAFRADLLSESLSGLQAMSVPEAPQAAEAVAAAAVSKDPAAGDAATASVEAPVEENLPSEDVEAAKPPATRPVPVEEINPPTDLQGEFIPDDPPYVQLAWNPNNHRKAYSYFIVYRQVVREDEVEAAPGEPVGTTKKPRFKDKDIEPGLTYRYQVTAMARWGEESDPSKPVEVVTYAPQPPQPPEGVEAVALDPGVDVAWKPFDDRAVAGYNVYRINGRKIKKVNRKPVADTHYYDKKGAAGDVYGVTTVNIFGQESEMVKVEAVPSVPVLYEEDDPAVSVEGLWVTEKYDGPTDGKIKVAGDAGSRLHFVFEGRQVKMIVAKYWTCGSADVYLDGELVDTVNLYSPDPVYQYVEVNVPGLAKGRHVITVEVLGYGNPEVDHNFVNVDAFEVH